MDYDNYFLSFLGILFFFIITPLLSVTGIQAIPGMAEGIL